MEQQDTKEVYLTEREIMREIVPIFRDYFIATFRRLDCGVVMKFPNGQKFIIRVMQA